MSACRGEAARLLGGAAALIPAGSIIGVLEMSPAAANAANFDLPIGLSPRPRDGSVVPSLHCMNDPQPEGSDGKLHRTTRILGHARRRGCGVAARGARAAAGD